MKKENMYPFVAVFILIFLSSILMINQQTKGDITEKFENINPKDIEKTNICYSSIEAKCVEHKDWNKGNCPSCGNHPSITINRKKDGKRILICSHCNEKWIYNRLRCPYCENSNQTQLGYFFLDGDFGYRAYYCKKCHKYILSIDERVIAQEVDLLNENFSGNSKLSILSKLIEKQGFIRPN